jgi:hypothetical protein
MLSRRDNGVGLEGGIVRAGRYLIGLAGVGLLAAGCGTVHAGQGSTQDTLVAAVSHTAAQTARITVTEGIQAPGMSMSYTQTGEFDFAHSRGIITMAAPADMTELFLPPKVYIKVSGMGSSLPGGKTWLVVDTRSSGALSSLLGPFGSTDNPADLLASLTAIAGSERILGPAAIGGVPATEYQVNIDPAKIAAKVPASERTSITQFLQSLGKGDIPVDVWVDGQNMVRQVRLALHLPGGAGAMIPGVTRLTETIDFSDFGVPVRVSAPPAGEVTSMSSGFTAAGIAVGSGSASAVASAVPAVSSSLPAVSVTGGMSAGSSPPVPPTVTASPVP